MPLFVLWIVLGVSIAVVLAAAGWMALQGYRLVRRGLRAQAGLTPIVDGLATRAEAAAGKGEALAGKATDFGDRLAGLQGSLTRVLILARALQEGPAGYRKLTDLLHQ